MSAADFIIGVNAARWPYGWYREPTPEQAARLAEIREEDQRAYMAQLNKGANWP